MASMEQRQQRVANGSNRKRDLAAVGKAGSAREWEENYKAKHFPDESRYSVSAAAHFVKKTNGGAYPDPKAVWARMQEKGWTNAQRGVK